ncbi:hypothetical protein L6452_38706 [Arctium lappa]|uniref:Uncharacterized protein n=1 Tax=Arctium lappa TaxID=4217 RepID=A0ACB8XQ94_ARCLA|nr:hypothetical protein L6452_38706 [Arctium lappa]
MVSGKGAGADKKNENDWNSKGITLADKIKGKTDSKIVLKYKAPIKLEDGRMAIRFSKEVVMKGAKSNALLLIAHFVGANMPYFVVNSNLNRLWKSLPDAIIGLITSLDGFSEKQAALCFL